MHGKILLYLMFLPNFKANNIVSLCLHVNYLITNMYEHFLHVYFIYQHLCLFFVLIYCGLRNSLLTYTRSFYTKDVHRFQAERAHKSPNSLTCHSGHGNVSQDGTPISLAHLVFKVRLFPFLTNLNKNIQFFVY